MTSLLLLQDDMLTLMLIVLAMQVTAIAYCWAVDMWEAWHDAR